MAKQNIYDNDSFFENFKNLRNNKINFNDCIETPILLAMIPEVNGKRVLDIGCGMGQHAKQYSDMGAESVLGIDISEKMLEYAKEHFHAKNITYRQMALEDICQIDEQFDLITSSLAFDYAEDLDKLMKNIYGLLKYGAILYLVCLIQWQPHGMVNMIDIPGQNRAKDFMRISATIWLREKGQSNGLSRTMKFIIEHFPVLLIL